MRCPARIETHVRLAQKILVPVDILQIRHVRGRTKGPVQFESLRVIDTHLARMPGALPGGSKGTGLLSTSQKHSLIRCRGRPEGSLFNSYHTAVLGRALLLSLDCSTLPLIRTLYCWELSKEVSSTILKVFGMTRPGIELRSSRTLGEHSIH